MLWMILIGVTVLTGVLSMLTYEPDNKSKAQLSGPEPSASTQLNKTPTGYSGHSRGLAVQVQTVGWSMAWRYAFALALPPLFYQQREPRRLSHGAQLRWDTLSVPGWPMLLHIREGALHGESRSLEKLPLQLDTLSALLLQVEGPTRALFEALHWDPAGLQNTSKSGVFGRRGLYRGRQMNVQIRPPAVIFRLEHHLSLHPEFRMGMGVSATHKTGDPVVDMVLGCQSPEPADLSKLHGRSETLLACLHPRPSWCLNGGHLQMRCEGPLDHVVAELAFGRATLAVLEA